jgi:hypothetical protein
MDRRLVRAAALGLIVLSCSWTSWSAQAGAASLPSHETVNTFVALDRLGESGTFSAVYAVSQGSLAGTVEVAQEASPRQRPFTTGPGKWSFLYQSLAGYASQWIERGTRAWDCRRAAGVTAWTCSGPGQFQLSNGFFLAVTPFIPGVVLGDINELTGGLKAHQVKGIQFFASMSARFGSLQCMKVDGTSSCLDDAGVLVSQQGGSYWTTITLLRRSSAVPSSAFVLKGRSTSSGRKFELLTL